MDDTIKELALIKWRENELQYAILDDNVEQLDSLIEDGCFFGPEHLFLSAKLGCIKSVFFFISKGLNKNIALEGGTEEVIKAIQIEDNYKKLQMSIMVINKINEFRNFINEHQPEMIPKPKRLKI